MRWLGLRICWLSLLIFVVGLGDFGGYRYLDLDMNGAVFWSRLGFFTAVVGSTLMAVDWYLNRRQERELADSHLVFYSLSSLSTNLALWIVASYFLPAFGR